MEARQVANNRDIDDRSVEDDIRNFFAEEVSTVDEASLNHDDVELFARVQRELDHTKPWERASIAEILQAIMYRGQIQKACFANFMFLQEQCLVTTKGLEKPMNLYSLPDDEIREVADALCCFDLLSAEKECPFLTYCTFNHLSTIIWLSTLIVRGAIEKSLWCLFERLSYSGELGTLNVERLRRVWPENRIVRVSEKSGPPLVVKGKLTPFAFWLPHSLGNNLDLHQAYKHFEADNFVPFEELYNRYIGLPDGSQQS